MMLVTGGGGFIGSHAVRALHERGEELVVARRSDSASPVIADVPYATERLDVSDLDALLGLGRRHRVTGIVHLAGSMPWPADDNAPVEQARRSLGGLFNLMEAATRWGVRRVCVASTIGVYTGLTADGPMSEDLPLPMTAPHPIPTFKKIGELLNHHLADITDLEIVNLRISGTWGPQGRKVDPFFAGPALVHAAARGTRPDAPNARSEHALDLCYVKDTGRAIALIQTADRLGHRTYNIGSGRSTTNAEIIAAIRRQVPDADVDLPHGGRASTAYLDIDRLRADTGYEPEYDLDKAVADYLRWLADHDR